MKTTKSAVRYAKALLELALEQNKTEVVSGDMQVIKTNFTETRDFQVFLDSPVINSDKKVEIFAELFPQFDELTMAFCRLMIKNKREGALAQIAASYDAQLKQHLGIIPVTIVSAKALDSATRKTIIGKLEGSLTGKLELEEQIDESLIGGFVIRMGDTRIDASVSGKLNQLKVSLTQ